MRNLKKMSAIFLSVIIMLSSINLAVLAEGATETEEDPFKDMIKISSDWQGSVFYTVGGNDKINAENFEITENENKTVKLRSSNNRGKIASGDEGIAYYFKDIPKGANFELTATAHVDEWTANNQVAFGLMLRGDVLYNENRGDGGHQGSYVAVGAVNQDLHGFHKNLGSAMVREKFEDAIAPAADQTYDLSIQRMGDTFVLKVGDETQVLDAHTGEINYAGLFTARNTTVTFSNVDLKIDDGKVELGDWAFSAFGDNTRTSDRNPDPAVNGNGSVRLAATGGKVSSSVDGISFQYKEVPANANFEITTKATVHSFNGTSSVSTPNQKSFGLMIRDEIGEHGDSSGHEANYVAVGALDQAMKAFYKHDTEHGKAQTKLDPFAGLNIPAANEVYDLSIRKAGNTYVVTANGQSETISADDLFNGQAFVGFYVARDAEVTFSDFDITVDSRNVSELKVDTTEMETEFLLGQSLNLNGLKVTAMFSDGSQQVLAESDYIVTGFNSSEVGTNTITINYNGVTKTVDLQILSLAVTALDIHYLPAKTVYYKGDTFNPQGFSVIANYEDGYKFAKLPDDQYTFSIGGIDGEGYVFDTAGNVEVTVISTETPETSTTFNVTVKDAELTELDIRQLPVKSLYFIDDELDLAGISVYANYDDNTSVMLMADEFVVSGFDSETTGEKELTLTHKGVQATFTVEVKVKELTKIEVTSYPKTTYVVGEDFTSAELEISKVFDNGDREVLGEDDYTIVSDAFNHAVAGTYDIQIVPANNQIDSISYQVTVRDVSEIEWKKMRFGQSSSDQRNYVNVKEDGAVEVIALEGGGKITGDHDGIAFYYTEIDAAEDNFVLSADIKVVEYAKTPYDGQESFGIMARDAVNPVQDASVFASNIAAVGGFSGGTREQNGTQAFIRTGVLASDGEGSQGIQKVMLENERPTSNNTYPETDYRLTLAKTNSGYTGQLNNREEVIFFEPDLLNVQDSKIYVGFYAARLATIEVSNIEFTVTAAATDAPKVEPPAQPINPNFEVLSLDKTPLEKYELIVRANAAGTITAKQGQQVIASEIEVKTGETLEIPATLVTNSNTNFSLTFLPDDTQYLTSYAPIVRNFTVQTKTFGGEDDIYVSPTGKSTGDGTRENPLNLDTAIEFVKPGQTIFVMEGNYVRNSNIEIKKYNDGNADAMKYLIADPEASSRPVIDFDKRSEGVVHSGNYWHVQGIDFARSAGNTKGYTIGGSHNIIEDVRLYEHGDTGLQISRTDSSEQDKSKWPSHNLVLNSISFDNRDPAENNADGFAAKLTVGQGNVFDGCISHNNIDDGWDLYTKVGTGAIGPVTIKNSIAFNNGTLTNGYEGNAGKNGFKLGGEGVHVPHVIKNSIAFGNGYFGFTSNSNPGLIAENNIGFNNIGANISFTTYAHIPTDFTIDGFVSYRTEEVGNANDNYPSKLDSDSNYMFKSGKSANASGEEPSANILVSLQAIFEFDNEGNIVAIKRDADGFIQWGDLWEVYDQFMNPEPSPSEEEDTSTPAKGEENVKVLPEVDGKGRGIVSSKKIQELAEKGHFMIDAKLFDHVQDFVLTRDQIKALIVKNATISIEKKGVTVRIPTSHFSGEEEISITVEKRNPGDVTIPAGKELKGEIFKFTILQGSHVVDQFKENPVTLEFVVDRAVSDTDNLSVFYLNEETNVWEEKTGGKYLEGVFYYAADHFSIYTVMEVVEQQEETTPVEETTPGEETTPEEETTPGEETTTSEDEKETDVSKLPTTFTGIYNLFVLGFVLVLVGMAFYVRKGRKERKLN